MESKSFALLFSLLVVSSLKDVCADELFGFEEQEELAEVSTNEFEKVYDFGILSAACKKTLVYNVNGRCSKSACKRICEIDDYEISKCIKSSTSGKIKKCHCFKDCKKENKEHSNNLPDYPSSSPPAKPPSNHPKISPSGFPEFSIFSRPNLSPAEAPEVSSSKAPNSYNSYEAEEFDTFETLNIEEGKNDDSDDKQKGDDNDEKHKKDTKEDRENNDDHDKKHKKHKKDDKDEKHKKDKKDKKRKKHTPSISAYPPSPSSTPYDHSTDISPTSTPFFSQLDNPDFSPSGAPFFSPADVASTKSFDSYNFFEDEEADIEY